MSEPLTDGVRVAALRILNSRPGRDLQRWATGALRAGAAINQGAIRLILEQQGEDAAVARVVVSVVVLRASAAVLAEGVEPPPERVGLDPVAVSILGRMRPERGN